MAVKRFSANTVKNSKEECKAAMTRSRMAIQANEDRAEEKVEGYKQQLTAEPALEPVSDRLTWTVLFLFFV